MPILILFVLCGLVFFRSLSGEFLNWDDAQHIALNPWLQSGDFLHFWQREYYGFYIPMAYTSWTWLFKLWPSPIAFHLLNLLLHFLNCVMVYFLSLKILSSSNMRGLDERAKDHTPFALFVAAIFAVHPLQVETVSWISAGRDIMAGFFGLSAVLLGWNTSDRLFPTWSATIRRVLATFLFVLGLLCKPGIVVLPLAIRWLSTFSERRGLKPLMMIFWSMLALAVAGLNSQIQSGHVTSQIPEVSWWQRPLIAGDALFHYLYKFVVPVTLSADYGRTPLVALESGMYWGLIGVVVLFVVTLGVLALFHRKPPRALWGALGFFVILMSPTLGFVTFSAQSISTVFDRYMYLPIIGLALAIASVLTTSKIPKLEIRYAVATLLVITCAVLSFYRVPVWHDDRALHSDMLSKNPRSYQAMVNLAIADLKDKNLQAATDWFSKAKESNPKIAVAWANLAHMYWVNNQPERIRDEIYPLLNSAEFVEFNKFEPQALALMWRMWARLNWRDKNLAVAGEAYCKARQLNSFDKDLEKETSTFKKENPDVPSCK